MTSAQTRLAKQRIGFGVILGALIHIEGMKLAATAVYNPLDMDLIRQSTTLSLIKRDLIPLRTLVWEAHIKPQDDVKD